jgi:hypothetical protein
MLGPNKYLTWQDTGFKFYTRELEYHFNCSIKGFCLVGPYNSPSDAPVAS